MKTVSWSNQNNSLVKSDVNNMSRLENSEGFSRRPKKKAKVKNNLNSTKHFRWQRAANHKRQPQLHSSSSK